MTVFTAWKFDEIDGAERAARVLHDAQDEGLVTVLDHAVLAWQIGEEAPSTHHVHDDSKRGGGWGALWGFLGGALFTIPVAGAALGAGIGALAKATQGTGITEKDLETLRTELTPGTSALFVVTENANLDRLGERLHDHKKLLSTNLTGVERTQLLETFGGE